MITETEPVKVALDELRLAQGGEKVELPDLVIRGAKDKLRELKSESESVREGREEITDWLLGGTGPAVDVAAADEVKHLGLVTDYDG
jgi:hypothetical protein